MHSDNRVDELLMLSSNVVSAIEPIKLFWGEKADVICGSDEFWNKTSPEYDGIVDTAASTIFWVENSPNSKADGDIKPESETGAKSYDQV